jgi:hypothetical protein
VQYDECELFISQYEKLFVCGRIYEMIITKSTPFSKDEINKLREVFDSYIKTVIDIN